jgi:CheY-like chemotaxis protein
MLDVRIYVESFAFRTRNPRRAWILDKGMTKNSNGSVRVLMVDDNQDFIEALAMLLKMNHHKVEMCFDGQSALALLETFRPTVVLLDSRMPGTNGYKLARAIRQTPGFERIQLIAVTGAGTPREEELSVEAGINHHLVKPVDPDLILRLIEEGS